jgi:uncharacterized protein YdeI (YjbR/CyaY-like superfamily)
VGFMKGGKGIDGDKMEQIETQRSQRTTECSFESLKPIADTNAAIFHCIKRLNDRSRMCLEWKEAPVN